MKYATAYTNQSTYRSVPDVSWSWIVKNPQSNTPDYFVLFGIHTDGAEFVFLYSRADFYRRAWRSKSGTHLRTSAKLKSDRKHYNYTPKIWKNHIAQPENNLINAVLNYDHQLALV